jgi:hypothetical protein
METCTLRTMLETDCYKNLLQLKVSLVRSKNEGLIFYQENISELTLDEPFEFYYVLTKGNITYQHAFPIPVHYYKPWMRNWIPFFPALAVVFTIITFNLMGEGLRQYFDNKLISASSTLSLIERIKQYIPTFSNNEKETKSLNK